MAERLVINTGPVVALARIGELDLVPRLGLDVVCPSEVRAELDAGVAAGHPAADVPWITVTPLTAPPSPIAAIVLADPPGACFRRRVTFGALRG